MSITMPLPKTPHAPRTWLSQIQLITLTESIDANGQASQVTTAINTTATVQPWRAASFVLKEAYERNLDYIMVHAQIQPNLTNAEYVRYNNARYRILERNQYQGGNFIEYHCVLDNTAT